MGNNCEDFKDELNKKFSNYEYKSKYASKKRKKSEDERERSCGKKHFLFRERLSPVFGLVKRLPTWLIVAKESEDPNYSIMSRRNGKKIAHMGNVLNKDRN